MTYQIILADDQPLARRCVKRILAGSTEVAVAAEVENGLALLKLLEGSMIAVDLVIVDISMPTMEGIEAIRRIKQLDLGVKTLVLSVHDEQDYLAKALRVGAAGYVVKGDADEELMPAIAAIRQGEIYISSCFKK